MNAYKDQMVNVANQINQRGTSLNSCQKRSLSRLRRKRISRILSFNEPFMPCGSSAIDFLIHVLD